MIRRDTGVDEQQKGDAHPFTPKRFDQKTRNHGNFTHLSLHASHLKGHTEQEGGAHLVVAADRQELAVR